MAVGPGTRIGPYEVVALIGQGGMGEVYRATDTYLGRQVAIKVLPAVFAQDGERLARFEREAKTLAALNHPGIATIHGVEKSPGSYALVMELVEGPTLADRIAQGSLAVDEALPIAKQIAEALEAAHEQGIIHRDLKPANIKVRDDGTVKVLDFGLAKAVESTSTVLASASMSPTITTPAMTQAGMILGTAAYMSPEQARGKPVDKRADIWAFGCVLFEMLTGRRAFPGEDVTDTLAAVVKLEPKWDLVSAEVPSRVLQVLHACLQKDPKLRLRDVGDLRLALEGTFERAVPQGLEAVAVAQPRWRGGMPFVAGAVVATLAMGLVMWRLGPAPDPGPVNRFAYTVPVDQRFRNTGRPVIVVSPDGRSFVYNTRAGFYLRALEALEARLIPGTEGDLLNLFFSPDGQRVAYWDRAAGQLKRIAITGGAPIVICATTTAGFGASWGADDTILFAQADGIMRVSANGGTPELVIRAEEGERLYGPQLLPDGESVLFSVTKGTWDEAQIVAQSFRTQKRSFIQGGRDGRYLSTGHLLYAVGNGVFAVALDTNQLRVSGGSVPVVEGLWTPPGGGFGGANYGVSRQGTLIYLSGVGLNNLSQLTWLDRRGQPQGLVGERTSGVRNFSLAPDESRVAFGIGGRGVWVTDLRRNVSSQLISAGDDPLWSPDGSRVAFDRGNLGRVLSVPASGGEERILFQAADGYQAYVEDWHPDGAHLALLLNGGSKERGVVAGTTGDQTPVVFDEVRDIDEPHFSPDGKWIAYNADRDGGGVEVYVVPYPPTGERVQVSPAGGGQARWRADGRELFYLTPGGILMAVEVKSEGGRFVPGVPTPLFETNLDVALNLDQYAVSRDGQRLLLSVPADTEDSAKPRQFIVVENWLEELKRLVPTK